MKMTDNRSIADIHTHILPFIDDGPKTAEESVQLLLEQRIQGVTDIVFTPHFNLDDTDIDAFLKKREVSYNALQAAIAQESSLADMRFYLGAEVSYNPNLIYEDLKKLCIDGTSYLLLELLPSYPFNLENTLFSIISQGITPILAHIERYDYLVASKKLMKSLAEAGVVFQCNASSVLNGHYKNRFKRLLKQGFVHIIASDTHNLEYRPPRLKAAYEKLKKQSGPLISNSVKVITDTQI